VISYLFSYNFHKYTYVRAPPKLTLMRFSSIRRNHKFGESICFARHRRSNPICPYPSDTTFSPQSLLPFPLALPTLDAVSSSSLTSDSSSSPLFLFSSFFLPLLTLFLKLRARHEKPWRSMCRPWQPHSSTCELFLPFVFNRIRVNTSKKTFIFLPDCDLEFLYGFIIAVA
jgi:hypothetical protein